MRATKRLTWIGLAAIGILILLLGAWSFSSRAQEARARSVLAHTVAPSLPAEVDGVLYVRHTLFELEGVPPSGGAYQPLTTTYELWIDGRQPTRFRQTIVDEPGGLRYAKVSDGATVWEYGLGDRQQAIERPITDEEKQSAGSVASFKCCSLADPALWVSKQGDKAQARYQGLEKLETWGDVQSVAVAWDGVTASTDRYKGRTHTVVMKTSVTNHWLVEWQDIVHAAEGDVLHRRYRLEAMETLAPAATPADLFTFIPPAGVMVKGPEEAAAQAETAAPAGATIALSGYTVLKLPFTPWLPTYLPEGFRLKSVSESAGGYLLQYEDRARMLSLRLRQKPNIRYNWGNTPETIELPNATVELGNGGPSAPARLVARVHINTAGVTPDFILDTSMAWNELLQVIRSLQPIE